MTIRNRQPTVAEIIAELDSPTGTIGFCKNIRNGVFHSWVEPPEIYIGAIGTWLRCDGSHAGFALNGMRDFGRDSRRQLRAAVDRWTLRQAQLACRLTDAINAAEATKLPRDYQWSESNIEKFTFGRDETIKAIREYNR